MLHRFTVRLNSVFASGLTLASLSGLDRFLQISFELEQKLLNNSYDLIDKSTYYNDLQAYNISSHDFRFTSARDKFEEKIKSGISQKEAKLKISQELNHKREAITDYYLRRTE